MDKVFSTRLDEAILSELDQLARRLGVSKKQILEDAIRSRANELQAAGVADVWALTFGAWKRRESPATTVRRGRRALEASLTRSRPKA